MNPFALRSLRLFFISFILSVFALLAVSASTPSLIAAPDANRTGIYQTGGFTFGSTQQLNPTILQGVDLEPEIKSDLFGNVYVTAIQGAGGGGVDLWKSTDKGNTFTFMGKPDGAGCPVGETCTDGAGLGGGDDSIDVSSGGYLYVSSLWLGSVVMSTSVDGGFSWQYQPYATDLPVVDRQWIAAYGPQTLYLGYAQIVGLDTPIVYVAKSTDAGKTFPQVTPVNDPLVIQNDRQGNLVVDQYNGNVYFSFIPSAANGHGPNELWSARSTDGGVTWTLRKAYQGPAGTDNRHSFPIMAVDRAGNLHLAFARCKIGPQGERSNCQIWLTSSSDQGDTWLPAVRVSNGSGNNAAVFPWIVAGSAGVVDVTWLGTNASSPDAESNSNWHLFFAQTRNALAASPTFSQVKAVSQVVHSQSICFRGLDCDINGGNRQLAEYYTMTIDPDGNANIAFIDDHTAQGCQDPQTNDCYGTTWYTKQTSGKRAYTLPAAPAAASFAKNYKIDPVQGPNDEHPGEVKTAGEPNIRIDSHDCIYVAAINLPSDAVGVWKSENHGQSFNIYRGVNNGVGLGGGDADIVTIPDPTRPQTDTLYISDLGLSSVHISKSTQGLHENPVPSAPPPANEANFSSDRMWFAADRLNGNQIIYQNDHELVTEDIRVFKSVNDGAWVGNSAITNPELLARTTPNTNTGNIFVDPRTHYVYTVFAASTNKNNAEDPPFGKLLEVWLAVSKDQGATWTNYPVLRGVMDSPSGAPAAARTYGTNAGNIFPVGGIDSAGNLYVTWVMNNSRTNTFDVWFAASRDGGQNFYGPWHVSHDAGTHVMPWLAAGDAGRVDIAWYGTSYVSDPNEIPDPDPGPSPATWRVYFGQSLNAGGREPVFSQVQASDHIMHDGSIRTGGLLGSSDRSLLDFFQIALDRAGMAHIIYADDGIRPPPSDAHPESTVLSYTRQIGGPSALTQPSTVHCVKPNALPTKTPVPTPVPSPTPSANADVKLVKTGQANTGGNPVIFKLDVSNQGKSPATNVRARDPLPKQVQFKSVSATKGRCGYNADTRVVHCRMAKLNPGEHVTIQIVTNSVSSQDFPNCARALSDTYDTNPRNNRSCITVHQEGGSRPTFEPVANTQGTNLPELFDSVWSGLTSLLNSGHQTALVHE